MRTLHLVKTNVGATWALRQMRELVGLGVEVHATVPPHGPLNPDYARAGIVVHEGNFDLPVKRPWRWPGLFLDLRQLVDRLRPDVIHSHFVGTTLTARLALGKGHSTPRIFQVPGPLHLEHGFFRRMEIITAGPSDYWVGSCNLTCQIYRRSGIGDRRIFLSYYGQDVDAFSGSNEGTLRQELGLPRERQLIGMIAYMYAPKWHLGQTRGLKGHEDLIDAIALCLDRRAEIQAVMVGGAWNNAMRYEQRVRNYARSRCGERVTFLGSRSDVPRLYPQFDVVVHPSHSENVGGAIESLLAGVPTITTDVGGFPDLIHPGETGWLAPAKDPSALAEAIMSVLSDPVEARRVARQGQALARRMFDVRSTAREVLEVYTEVTGASRDS